MASRLKCVLTQPTTSWSEADRRRARVEDYLDHLCAPLLGLVPYPERTSLRTEVEEHLYALIDDYETEGLAAVAATEAALSAHGEPWQIGEAFAASYSRSNTAPTGALRRFTDSSAALNTFAFVGAASVINILFVQYIALTPSSYSYLQPYSVVLSVIAPLVAGALIGWRSPMISLRSLGAAMALVLLHSGATAAMMWPQRDELYLFATQALFWPPAVAGTAYAVAAIHRHRRRVRFLRWTTH